MDNFFDSILERSFEWYETQETIPEGLSFHGEESDLPLLDEIDTLILMHRDVHFSGSFTAMLEYYRNESAKGIQDEVEIERIRFLESPKGSLLQLLSQSVVRRNWLTSCCQSCEEMKNYYFHLQLLTFY